MPPNANPQSKTSLYSLLSGSSWSRQNDSNTDNFSPRLFLAPFLLRSSFLTLLTKCCLSAGCRLSVHTKKRRREVDEPETWLDLAATTSTVEKNHISSESNTWCWPVTTRQRRPKTSLRFVTYYIIVCVRDNWQNWRNNGNGGTYIWRSDPGEIEIYNTPLLCCLIFDGNHVFHGKDGGRLILVPLPAKSLDPRHWSNPLGFGPRIFALLAPCS